MVAVVILARALAGAAFTLVALQLVDKGMWWHACTLRGIRKNADTEELYQTGAKTRKFLVPTKVIPALLVCIGAAWMSAVVGAFGGLMLCLIGIVAFMTASTTDALRTLWRLDGR